ncbi:unnamed protein product [Miscanthus lutarioriparius]|uniref:Uncharacterized protein n=1 Tax=Miscanthus lutarioriparius TaxID=422564 RepID=A0A811Q928_9POAL|nr:unnamed protein product [Miscanthus lutarioriparius]
MAAALDALAPYVKKLIADMAQEEVSMLLGVSAEITKLENNMEGLKAFMADAERRHITDTSVQRWSTKLNNAMYDATDILDLCQLEADKRRESRGGDGVEQKLPSCFQPLLFCLRNPMFAHKIGSRIKELNQRLESIYKEADKYKFNIGLGSNPEPRKLTAAELSSYRTSSLVDESAIVGEQIERDTTELIHLLTSSDNNHNIKVVSIIGVGGMGKTTLAQKIFNDATIQEHFKTKTIWLSITQQFDEVELLRTAIKHAGGDHGAEKDKNTLTETLFHTLSSGRFLLVMDDVWSQKVWNDVLSVPVRNASKKQPGSRVLVTTRSAHLPQQMQAPLHQHRVKPLENDDAWSLLKKQLQPDLVDGIDQLKTIGMEILENCDGLPLAIKVIGGLLSTRYPSEHEWKSVLNKPAWSLTGQPPELDNRLYLSYDDLSPQIKQCFLYCSLFPKGKEIIGNVVTQMWISEGFIQPLDGSSIISHEYGFEEMATEYYRELIKRNLIEPIEGCLLTEYRCTMHDVVRTFAEYMAREESLVVVVGREHAATDRISTGWGNFAKRESLRTLIINSRVNFHLPGDSLSSFSSLRVLYICSANSDTLVPFLSKLKHLRYLHLEDTDISRLPDDIHKMKFLLYIYLLGCKKMGYLPSKIIKLVHLRSLDTTSSNISAAPKGFGELTNLRSLFSFPVHVDMDASNSWCSLQELEHLSQLRDLTLYGLEKVQDSRMAEKAMISSKRHLGYLELNYSASGHTIGTGGGEAEQQQQQSVTEEVLEKLCPPISLENLSLEGGYVGRQLPNWMCAPASADFKSLRYLRLENLPCCTQLPDGLCCLPSLEGLTITDAPVIKRIGPQFQASSSVAAGGSTASTSAPFPKLRNLQLIGLCEWEEWEWNNCEEHRDVETAIAMPCLERLQIQNCKLSCLPPGLASTKRRTLRELWLYKLTNLTHVENIPSVVKLDVFDCPELKKISGLSMLQKIRIVRCPKLEVLEGVAALDSLVLEDATMDTLPDYLRAVNPRYLELYCNKKLHESSSSPGVAILQAVVTEMWISEGLIQPPDKRRSTSSHEYGLEDIATEYYRDLIKRNLIEPMEVYSLTGYRCTMHDVVRSFAEYMGFSAVPKGFSELTNLRSFRGFPVHVDMDASNSWCSLQELEPLSQLRDLTLYGLEKVHDSRMAEKTMISSKRHLGYLELNYSASGHTIGTGGAEAEQQQQQSGHT